MKHHRYLARMTVIGLTAFGAAGCGAIFGGTHEDIRIASVPTAARVSSDPAVGSATTPVTLELPRRNTYVITASLDGYESAEVVIRQRMRVGILVLDILTGLIGVLVDGLTGAWYDLSPDEATLVLEQRDASLEGPDRVRVRLGLDGSGDAPTLTVTPDDAEVRITVRILD